jgi:DNA-binding NarL/FixJ family response regulator
MCRMAEKRYFFARCLHPLLLLHSMSDNTLPAPLRLLLVDDQSIMIDGLQALLSQYTELEVVGSAGNGAEAVEQARRLQPDVVIMDISMPDMDGIEATRRIMAEGLPCRVLVLSMYHNVAFVKELLAAGASGYLLKNTGREVLHEAILKVAGGGTYLAAVVQELLDGSPSPTGEAEEVKLTRREKEVLLMLAEGLTTIEAANRLNLSEHTVDTHRKNIMAKLGVRNVAGLVKYALERGWMH